MQRCGFAKVRLGVIEFAIAKLVLENLFLRNLKLPRKQPERQNSTTMRKVRGMRMNVAFHTDFEKASKLLHVQAGMRMLGLVSSVYASQHLVACA